MGSYNLIGWRLQCPRCGHIGEIEIEAKVGQLNFLRYRLGDEVQWAPGESVKRGARPKNGNLDGEGYAECTLCRRDYFLVIEIRNDRIAAVRVDSSRPGFVT